MQRLKPKFVPSCNRKLIFSAIKDNKRVDGRESKDFRKLNIGFGLDYGSSVVSLGETRVMCNIAYVITEPKLTKSCEGFLNIRISATLVHLHEKIVEILKIIEKNLKESRCLDLESLCIISGEKVYSLSADLVVLNDEGNLSECCSIALLASLAHFKRPDVSVVEDKIKIHSFSDAHPIPLNILHYPFCTSFSFFENSSFVCDSIHEEEQVCDGYLIVGANVYREITAIHVSGKSAITKDFVMSCCQLAIERSKFLTDFVKSAVQDDMAKRAVDSASVGFTPFIKENSSALCCHEKEEIRLSSSSEKQEEEEDVIPLEIVQNTKIFRYAPDTFGIGEGKVNKWDFISSFKEEKTVSLDENH